MQMTDWLDGKQNYILQTELRVQMVFKVVTETIVLFTVLAITPVTFHWVLRAMR